MPGDGIHQLPPHRRPEAGYGVFVYGAAGAVGSAVCQMPSSGAGRSISRDGREDAGSRASASTAVNYKKGNLLDNGQQRPKGHRHHFDKSAASTSRGARVRAFGAHECA